MQENKIISFASDNYCGAHPNVVTEISKASQADDFPYSNDSFTENVRQIFKKEFGSSAHAYFVGNGTAANICALSQIMKSTDAVICADSAHINTAECGAFEKFVGAKIIAIPHVDGKLNVEQAEHLLSQPRAVHYNNIKVISISQSTEFGTVYTVEEMKEIKKLCQKYNLYFHVDGSRFYNACAHLDVSLRQISQEVGVDVLSLGGTKNGLLLAESIIFFNENMCENFLSTQKQSMQLFSKGRFIACQYQALFANQLWKSNAQNANKMTAELHKKIKDNPIFTITSTVQSNMIFIQMPVKAYEKLSSRYYLNIVEIFAKSKTCIVRFVTNFQTKQEDVDNLADFMMSIKA